jgi:hypothetical protein
MQQIQHDCNGYGAVQATILSHNYKQKSMNMISSLSLLLVQLDLTSRLNCWRYLFQPHTIDHVFLSQIYIHNQQPFTL